MPLGFGRERTGVGATRQQGMGGVRADVAATRRHGARARSGWRGQKLNGDGRGIWCRSDEGGGGSDGGGGKSAPVGELLRERGRNGEREREDEKRVGAPSLERGTRATHVRGGGGGAAERRWAEEKRAHKNPREAK